MLERQLIVPVAPGPPGKPLENPVVPGLIDPEKLPLALLSARPPIIRPHTPPAVWSGWAFGSPTANASPWAWKAVFMVPITDVMALVEPTTPPMICVNGLYTAGNVLVQPGCTWAKAWAEACEGAKPERREARPPASGAAFFERRGCQLCLALWRLRARPHDFWTKHLPSVCLNDVPTGEDEAIPQPPPTIGRRFIGERLCPPLRSWCRA